MERAPLRPVPSRPREQIAPAEALRHVTAELPGLDDPAAGALALRVLVGLTRDQIADASDPPSVTDLSGESLAEALARGRKALRRSLYPLPGSGWCERAERLISDRLDDTLEDPGPRRLDVHLVNCSRCVEHERRLAQSQDALVEAFPEANPAQETEAESLADEAQVDGGEEAADSAPPLLRAVDTPILLPAPETDALPAPDSPADALPVLETEEPAQLDGESGEPEDQPAQLDGESGEPDDRPAQLESPAEEPVHLEPAPAAVEPPPAAPPEVQVEPAEQPEASPPAAVPAAWRRSSATLWSPAVPSPPRMPVATDRPAPAPLRPSPPPVTRAAAPPVASPEPEPAVSSTPAPDPPADPAPAAPPASTWTSEPPRMWSPPPQAPNAWRNESPRPTLAAHRTLQSQSVWTAIGPLVAVLSVAVVIGVLAALLAVG